MLKDMESYLIYIRIYIRYRMANNDFFHDDNNNHDWERGERCKGHVMITIVMIMSIYMIYMYSYSF